MEALIDNKEYQSISKDRSALDPTTNKLPIQRQTILGMSGWGTGRGERSGRGRDRGGRTTRGTNYSGAPPNRSHAMKYSAEYKQRFMNVRAGIGDGKGIGKAKGRAINWIDNTTTKQRRLEKRMLQQRSPLHWEIKIQGRFSAARKLAL